MFEDFSQKASVVIVYTGEGMGKTCASVGLMARALGTGWKVAYVQFIQHWDVGEHQFIRDIAEVYKDKLVLHKGGKGFYHAGALSAKNVSDDEHEAAAQKTYDFAKEAAASGDYDVVICDEINNAAHDGLLEESAIAELIAAKHEKTSLCLTGRDFPESLIDQVDIATNMTKIKHHFDDKFLANKGIDY